MIATLVFILSVGIVIYAIKTKDIERDLEGSIEEKTIELKHFNTKAIAIMQEELELEATTEEKTIEYLKDIEYNTRSAKNSLMFIRVLYIIALIGGLILISQ